MLVERSAMIYTGIGSRETPSDVLDEMRTMASEFATAGYVLRSGGAPGADTAFEVGATLAHGQMEIYLPWRAFNHNESLRFSVDPSAMRLAAQFHPAWHLCSPAARKMHARNCYQVLGADLKTPTDFVMCWTKSGSGSGGTGQALRIARAYEIPIFDLGGGPGVVTEMGRFLSGATRRSAAASTSSGLADSSPPRLMAPSQ